jgi:hypothetical protein
VSESLSDHTVRQTELSLESGAYLQTREISRYEPEQDLFGDQYAEKLGRWKPSDNPVNIFFDLAKQEKGVTVEARLLLKDGKTAVTVNLNETDVRQALETTSIAEVAARARMRSFREAHREWTTGKSDSHIKEALKLRSLVESAKPEDQKALLEDGPYGGDIQFDLNQNFTSLYSQGFDADEYLPLGNGPFNQQLYLYDYWEMLAKSFYATNHDPVARRIIDLVADFTLGRGFTVRFASPEAQHEWEEFAAQNCFEERITDWFKGLIRDGNAFDRFFRNGVKPPTMVTLEPSTFMEIITEPENINDVKAYWQQYQTQYQIYTVPGTASYKYVIRQIPADEIIHTRFNCSKWEKFGRSILFPVLAWLKRLRDYYNAETLRAQIQAAFAWDITITGSQVDTQNVANYATQNPMPDLRTPGRALYHNDAVKVQALHADRVQTSTGSIGVGDGILGIIAVGVGLSKPYFGVTGRGSRATANTETEPTMKHIQALQKIVKYYIEHVSAKVLTWAQQENRVPTHVKRPADKRTLRDVVHHLRKGDFKRAMHGIKVLFTGGEVVELDRTIEVIFPDIVKGDLAATIANAQRAESNNYLSKRQAAEIVSSGFELSEYDFDETQDEIADEMKHPTTSVINREGSQVDKGGPMEGEIAYPPGSVPNPSAGLTPPPGFQQPAGGPKTPPQQPAAPSATQNPAGNAGAEIRNDKTDRREARTITFEFEER